MNNILSTHLTIEEFTASSITNKERNNMWFKNKKKEEYEINYYIERAKPITDVLDKECPGIDYIFNRGIFYIILEDEYVSITILDPDYIKLEEIIKKFQKEQKAKEAFLARLEKNKEEMK